MRIAPSVSKRAIRAGALDQSKWGRRSGRWSWGWMDDAVRRARERWHGFEKLQHHSFSTPQDPNRVDLKLRRTSTPDGRDMVGFWVQGQTGRDTLILLVDAKYFGGRITRCACTAGRLLARLVEALSHLFSLWTYQLHSSPSQRLLLIWNRVT